MQFVCFDSWHQLPASSHSLFEKAAQKSLFFSYPWISHLLSQGLDPEQSLLIACVLDHERAVAILPLVQTGPQTLRSIGHLYSSLFTLLLADEQQLEVVKTMAAGLAEMPIRSLRLEPVAQEDTALHALTETLQPYGFSAQRYFSFYNWYQPTAALSYAQYMAGRPPRVRNTIARKQRKLQREHGYSIRLYTDNDLQQAMSDYNAVYRASWKANEVHEHFVDKLAHVLSEQSWLRLAVLYVDDVPVAAQFWFVAHQRASIFKLVYDEAWKRYSPGSILTSHLMEQVIDQDKVIEIDFLTGNDAYKQDWMSERRERCGLYLVRQQQPQSRSSRLLESIGTWFGKKSN